MPWLFLTLSPPHPIFKSCLLYGALPKCPKSPHLGGLPLARWLSSSSRVPHSSSRLCTAHPPLNLAGEPNLAEHAHRMPCGSLCDVGVKPSNATTTRVDLHLWGQISLDGPSHVSDFPGLHSSLVTATKIVPTSLTLGELSQLDLVALGNFYF